jgi:ribose 5-phosphate isomerase B
VALKIHIGADHNGFEFKKRLSEYLRRSDYDIIDDGDKKLDPRDDYPQFGGRVATSLLADKDPDSRGILICGSGQGICIAANRFKGIRAALCWNVEEARAARNDDDCNVLCLSSRYLTLEDTMPIVSSFLATPFAGASRFKRRIRELDEL